MTNKNKRILVGIHGRPSMKLTYGSMSKGELFVRRRLVKKNKVYYRHYQNNDSENLTKKRSVNMENTILIRWGTREVVDTDAGTVTYNKAPAIKLATDKKESRRQFMMHGVFAPKTVTMMNVERKDLPIIARPSVHAKGKNFVVLRTIAEFNEHYSQYANHGWYYSAFINKQHEYRVHMAHGKALAVMRKPKPEDPNKIAWNRAINEDPFVYVPWEECNRVHIKNAILEASKACKALGLDFGGVDVITYGSHAYVLEVNTSPTLNSSEYVATRYGKYFDLLFSQNKRMPHWDTANFQEGQSMIWKNKQLNPANLTETLSRIEKRRNEETSPATS